MTEINYVLLKKFRTKSHPSVPYPYAENTTEIYNEIDSARTAHHLLDLIDIPVRPGLALDARVYLAVVELLRLQDRLDRIRTWHSRESKAAGMVGDHCIECGTWWPCDTSRMADGTHEEIG